MLIAQATTGETISIAAIIGTIFGIIQLAALVFRKKGDTDPVTMAVKKELVTFKEGVKADFAAIKEELRLAAAALVVAESRMNTVEAALRLSAAKDLAEINQRAHETRLGLANVLNTAESDRLHFNEVIHELRKVVEEIRHAVWGDGVPGLKQDQRTSEMKIDHLKEDLDRIKGKP